MSDTCLPPPPPPYFKPVVSHNRAPILLYSKKPIASQKSFRTTMGFAYDVLCCTWLPKMKNQLKWVRSHIKDAIFEKEEEKVKDDLEEMGADVEAGEKNNAAIKEGTGKKKNKFKDPFMIYFYVILAFNCTTIVAILNNANHVPQSTLILNVLCFILAPFFITFIHSTNPTRKFILFAALIMTVLLFSTGLSIVIDAFIHPRHPQAPSASPQAPPAPNAP